MGSVENEDPNANGTVRRKPADKASEYAHQAEQLGAWHHSDADGEPTYAVKAKFVTPLDPVVVTADGGRLPTIPVAEAKKLNELRSEIHKSSSSASLDSLRNGLQAIYRSARPTIVAGKQEENEQNDASLGESLPPSRTNPLFPPLPIYGPPTLLRSIQCFCFRITSAVLSLLFLLSIFTGTVINEIPRLGKNVSSRARFQNPQRWRPFYEEEEQRARERKAAQKAWVAQQKKLKREKKGATQIVSSDKASGIPQAGEFVPTEGGPDPLCVDVGYYARRVGLDVETFEVQTEDGFLIELNHIFNPREYRRRPSRDRQQDGPEVFMTSGEDQAFARTQPFPAADKKYPVLMMPGLLQSAGTFCSNDDDSLAFYLAKSGYDVWLGNNRCGFVPKHTMLEYGDPRMWAWNIRQMGVLDLPALISRVLAETGFPKLALIAHSQGTTETFVALAKEQRPDVGNKISVFCALAPAAYAGPLISKIYFQVMRIVSPAMFRVIFGIHSFIPFMMFAHKVLPAKPYSWLGYHVFSHLFNWTDTRWDRRLRNRMFQFAPVYVSAESMRWWLGRECFAKQRCILATREEGKQEDKEDEEDDDVIRQAYIDREPQVTARKKLQRNVSSFHCQSPTHSHHDSMRGKYAWYDDQFPPLALWVAGADDLVDGRRLLRRFDRGREPHVRVVHRKIIEGYEHLDVIWAMDAIEQVGKEVREVIWRTVDAEDALKCRVPIGCSKPLEEDVDIHDDVPMLHSGGRLRMASISELPSEARLSGGGRRSTSPLLPRGPARYAATLERTGEDSNDVFGQEKGYERRMSEAVFVDLQERGNPLG